MEIQPKIKKRVKGTVTAYLIQNRIQKLIKSKGKGMIIYVNKRGLRKVINYAVVENKLLKASKRKLYQLRDETNIDVIINSILTV